MNNLEDKEFYDFIFNIYQHSKMKDKYIKLILDENISSYRELFSKTEKYKVYKMLGLTTLKKFLAWYIFNFHPSDFDKLNEIYKDNKVFINFLINNSFKDYSDNDDIFYIYLGYTEELIDKKTKVGVGYGIISNFLTKVYDKFYIKYVINKKYGEDI